MKTHSKQGSLLSATIIVALAVALITVPKPQPAKAQDPVSAGLVGLGVKFLVSDILNDFDKKAQNLIDRGQLAGDLVVAHAGNELQLMVANLRVMLGDLEKKTFQDLTDQQQRLFQNLNSSLDRVQYIVGEIRPMSELILLDVQRMINRTLLATDKQDFYISSVRGTTLACQDHEYRVEVTGLGLSFNGNEPKCVVDALLDGKELDAFTSITQVENSRILVKIPAKQLNHLFKDDKVVTVPFAIRSTITRGDKSKTYQVNVRLVLLPKAAGQIEITETVEKKKWSDKNETKTITISHPVDGAKQYVESWTCAPNQRIVGVDYECDHPAAGWCYNSRKRGYSPDFDIVDDGKKAVVYRELQVKGLVCHYHVRYQTELIAFEKVNNGRMTVKFDDPFEVNLSPNNKDGNFKVTGHLFTGQKILLSSAFAQAAEKESPLRLVGSERIGDHVRATFKLVKLP